MLEETVTLTNKLGLHARAAVQVVRLSREFVSDIVFDRADLERTANAGSILSLLSLSASHGVELRIRVEGDDEEKALSAMRSLFANEFGEGQ